MSDKDRIVMEALVVKAFTIWMPVGMVMGAIVGYFWGRLPIWVGCGMMAGMSVGMGVAALRGFLKR